MQEELVVPLAIIAVVALAAWIQKKDGNDYQKKREELQAIMVEMRFLAGPKANDISAAIWSQLQTQVKRLLEMQYCCRQKIIHDERCLCEHMDLQAFQDLLGSIRRDGVFRCIQKPREAQAVVNEYREMIDRLETPHRPNKKAQYA